MYKTEGTIEKQANLKVVVENGEKNPSPSKCKGAKLELESHSLIAHLIQTFVGLTLYWDWELIGQEPWSQANGISWTSI